MCYELGNVSELIKFADGTEAQLVPKGKSGRYALLVEEDEIYIYVLKQMLTLSRD